MNKIQYKDFLVKQAFFLKRDDNPNLKAHFLGNLPEKARKKEKKKNLALYLINLKVFDLVCSSMFFSVSVGFTKTG